MHYEITEEQFEERFCPRVGADGYIQYDWQNPRDRDAISAAWRDRRLWTSVDGGDGQWCLVSGERLMQRNYYVICEVPTPEGVAFTVKEPMVTCVKCGAVTELPDRPSAGVAEVEKLFPLSANWHFPDGQEYLAQRELALNLARERDMWKANHDNQVELKRIIAARPDLGERAPMVERLVAERDDLKRQLEAELRSFNTLTNDNSDLRLENAVLRRELAFKTMKY